MMIIPKVKRKYEKLEFINDCNLDLSLKLLYEPDA